MSDAPVPGAASAADDTNKNGIETVEHVPQASTSAAAAHGSHKLDAAAELLRKMGGGPGERIIVTPADDRRVLRKIDLVPGPSS